jgi:hypothetical protein
LPDGVAAMPMMGALSGVVMDPKFWASPSVETWPAAS